LDAVTAREILDCRLEGEPGIGPARAAKLAALGLVTARDLVLYAPRAYREWGPRRAIASLAAGDEAHVVGRVVSARRLGWRRGRRAAEAVIEDASGRIACVWFGVAWLAGSLAKGSWVRAAGRVARRGDALQLVHPEFEISKEPFDDDDAHLSPRAVHRTGVGVSERMLGRLLERILERLEGARFRDPLSAQGVARCSADGALAAAARGSESGGTAVARAARPASLVPQGALPLDVAVRALHFPASLAHAEEARRRIAFDELLLLQERFDDAAHPAASPPESSSYAGAAADRMARRSRALHGEPLADRYVASLPFALTAGQRSALDALLGDLAAPRPMNRLLMGDVGCGKTAVFVAALLRVIDAGAQGALLAPTEILARQHGDRLASDLAPYGVRVALLLGTTPSAERAGIRDALRDGSIDLLVGTHAILVKDVVFRRLGLGVIDEQQRFGVAQRARLREKSRTAVVSAEPNLLVVSATPIPRTLAMALYGDLATTTIPDLPPGRAPIETVAYRDQERRAGYARLREILRAGAQAYLVFPLIEEGEDKAIVSVTRAYEKLRDGFFRGIPTALVHGALRERERQHAMDAFTTGDVRLLLGTSVVEVGIDNPRAAAIGIEHAERFGLAALHQLRGRVGRGQEPSVCLLFSRGPLSAKAAGRIEAMLSTTNGFEIAERDLSLRGPGEFSGVRQSGFLDLDIADLARDETLLEQARTTMRVLREGEREGDAAARDAVASLRAWWGDRCRESDAPRASYHDVG
jgi:ATP-dependent DNA helicase RecG